MGTLPRRHDPFPATTKNDIASNMRLVLDTDVLPSGLRSTIGASRILLLAVEAGVVTPLVSVATVIEYEAVLKRLEHLQAALLDAEEVDRFLDDLVAARQSHHVTLPDTALGKGSR